MSPSCLMTTFRTPVAGQRNILITSALPYVNNVPHLGNIIGCLLSGDIYSRYCRLRGYNTLYVCGTDEYGTATETKALEEGVDCQTLCDRYYKLHDEIYTWFGIDLNVFGRSATTLQTKITQEIFWDLWKKNYFKIDNMDQLQCPCCHRFLADRYVEGECPHCGTAGARGDQCDACGKLLNATELIHPKCKLDAATPTIQQSRHLFLDLEELQSACEAFAERSRRLGHWSSNSFEITRAWFSKGLKNRCITRDLKWGTPVPLPEMADKVFYVWFDACIGYISITANAFPDSWRSWWQNPDNVELVQFMGKDNVPFHTVIFPSTLLGTGQPWTLLHSISTTEYLNYEDGKFSKSRGVGVFGHHAKETGLSPSIWRYYLAINRPEISDSVFSWDDLGAKVNADLVGNLGNFVSRVMKFTAKNYHSIVPPLGSSTTTSHIHYPYEMDQDPRLNQQDKDFIHAVNEELKSYQDAFESIKLKAALKHAMAISALANGYLTSMHLSNSLLQSSPGVCNNVIHIAVNLTYLLSGLLYPFIPETSAAITRQLNVPLRGLYTETTDHALTFGYDDILEGHGIGEPEHLFKKLEQTELDAWRGKFAGKDVTPALLPPSKTKAGKSTQKQQATTVPDSQVKDLANGLQKSLNITE